MSITKEEHQRRWRLILGGGEADGIGLQMTGADVKMDAALEALYDPDVKRSGGLGSSAPNAVRWLGDIRNYFPTAVVQVMQMDALKRLNMKQMLLEPEMLANVQPDVNLAAMLISLKHLIPSKTKDTARTVVRKVVEEIEKKLANPLRQAIQGSLNRSARNRRPKHHEIDWNRTIRANLKHYQKEYKTVIPETRIGFGRKTSASREIIICIDQSGSMATSVVYSGIFGAVMASMRSVKTSMVVFDTAVVDLTAQLHDPVELLFATQLGGGTDIEKALTYSQSLIKAPTETIFVLISDLIEPGSHQKVMQRAASIVSSGVRMVTLLALTDRGKPVYDHNLAAGFAGLGIPSFACTPELFPDMMAAAIQKQDLGVWAAAKGIKTSAPDSGEAT